MSEPTVAITVSMDSVSAGWAFEAKRRGQLVATGNGYDQPQIALQAGIQRFQAFIAQGPFVDTVARPS